MSIENIITALDDEITHLQQARSLLASLGGTEALHTATATKPVTKKRKRSRLSAEARKRIGDAQRKRWAKQKSQK
jgi:hypothetical protein